MLLRPLSFHLPASVQEAAQLQASLPDVRILAGGTFLINSLKLLKRKGSKTPAHIISLKNIKDLRGVTIQNHELLIKAMTIVNELYDSPHLRGNTAILREVCKNISTTPIRNMATIGGNLTCRYTWTEMGAIMIALEAKMHFIGADGQDEVIPSETFFKNGARADKIFTHVAIPIDDTAIVAYERVKKSPNVDIPLLTVCLKAVVKDQTLTHVIVSINNGTAFAQRDSKLEHFLNGKKLSSTLPQEALGHLDTEIYDKRSDEYKQHMFRVSIKNALTKIICEQ